PPLGHAVLELCASRPGDVVVLPRGAALAGLIVGVDEALRLEAVQQRIERRLAQQRVVAVELLAERLQDAEAVVVAPDEDVQHEPVQPALQHLTVALGSVGSHACLGLQRQAYVSRAVSHEPQLEPEPQPHQRAATAAVNETTSLAFVSEIARRPALTSLAS